LLLKVRSSTRSTGPNTEAAFVSSGSSIADEATDRHGRLSVP